MNRGSYSFELKIEHKDKLRKALNRCRRSRALLDQANSFFGRLKFTFYAIYADLLSEFVFRNDEGGSAAVTYFFVASHYIVSVEGRDLNKTTTRITYNART